MSDVRIRRAESDDALVVAALNLQFAISMGARSEPGYLDRFAEAWLRDLEHRPTWLAEAGDHHAGVAIGALVDHLPWPGRTAGAGWLNLSTVFVRAEFRGKGVAAALLHEVTDWARTQGLAAVRLTATEDSADLYRGAGFTGEGRLLELVLDGGR